MKQKTHFTTVKIKCKPVVKAYLENNFGTSPSTPSPSTGSEAGSSVTGAKVVTIPENHFLMKHALAQLSKTNSRCDYFRDFTEEIELTIGSKQFEKDGFCINQANTTNFNNSVIDYMKSLARTSIDTALVGREKYNNWRERLFKLVAILQGKGGLTVREARELRREADEHKVELQDAIYYAIEHVLKVDIDVLSYENVKKDYYRYHTKPVVIEDKNFGRICPLT